MASQLVARFVDTGDLENLTRAIIDHRPDAAFVTDRVIRRGEIIAGIERDHLHQALKTACGADLRHVARLVGIPQQLMPVILLGLRRGESVLTARLGKNWPEHGHLFLCHTLSLD